MGHFKHISVDATRQMLEGGGTQLVDIRDRQSYDNSHISGATHLDSSTVQGFIEQADPDHPVIVYCYHGNSSQGAAAFLAEKGFDEVYSMDGGFEEWRGQYPVEQQ